MPRLGPLSLARIHSGTLVGKQSAAIGGGNGQNRAVLAMLVAFLGSLCSLARTRGDLTLENLALRQQLVVLRRVRPKRLRLTGPDRIFWAWLSLIWAYWAAAAPGESGPIMGPILPRTLPSLQGPGHVPVFGCEGDVAHPGRVAGWNRALSGGL